MTANMFDVIEQFICAKSRLASAFFFIERLSERLLFLMMSAYFDEELTATTVTTTAHGNENQSQAGTGFLSLQTSASLEWWWVCCYQDDENEMKKFHSRYRKEEKNPKRVELFFQSLLDFHSYRIMMMMSNVYNTSSKQRECLRRMRLAVESGTFTSYE